MSEAQVPAKGIPSHTYEASQVSTFHSTRHLEYWLLSLTKDIQTTLLGQLSLIQEAAIGAEVEFDARVHAVKRRQLESNITTLTMRSDGHFLQVTADASTVAAATWTAAQKCTVESILRVRGIVRSPSDDSSLHDSRVAVVEAVKVTVLSLADKDLPKAVSHGGPVEQEAAISLTLQERLNNRVLDVRVAATGAIFQLLSGLNELSIEYCFAHDFKYVLPLHKLQLFLCVCILQF